ncbi:MAG: hypothetical protein Q7K34_00230, partial [archaeon]|nr:hypothetical protein [archaeon]
MKRRIFIVFALLAFSSLAGAEVFYWLRGNDVKTGIDGGENFFISGTAPNASSTATEIIVETKKGTGIIGKWYSPAFSETFLLSGKAFLLANKFKQLLGNTAVGFSIYEFDEETLEETLIVSSGFEKPSPTLALEAGLENGFVVGSKKRLKLLVNYIEESGKGKLSLTLDEGFAFKETVFETPSGVKARATGADGTAVLVLDACLESGIACTTGTECSDQDNFTTDSCSLGGTCRALCVYTACGASCTSNAQCSDGEPLTFDKCEKLGFCDSFCTNDSCTPLCTSSTDCGDSNLLTLDTCMYPGTCVSACKNTPCSGGECSVTEQKVFCGDNVCQYQEDCPGDCEVGKNIGLLGYRKEDYFVLGEEIVFRAKPTGFSKKPAVFAKGFF